MKFLKEYFIQLKLDRRERTKKEKERKKPFHEKFIATGLFTYEDDGFTIKLKDTEQKILWPEVDQLVAYKVDLFTVDEICLDIIYGDFQITITEETPGWYQFIEKTKMVFSSIEKDWDTKIIHPPFAENLVKVYEKQG